MTPTPPSTSASSAGGHSPDAQYRVVRKRNRVPLSCAPCRHRKLKCNRSHPCENCVRRGDASSCSYAAPGTRRKNQSQGGTSPDDMQNRIDRLEGLVLSLMTNGAQSAGPTAAHAAVERSQSDRSGSVSVSLMQGVDGDDDDMIKEEGDEEGDMSDGEVDGVTERFGVLKVDAAKGKSMYFGDSHWHMVLADIAEVRNYFTNHKKDLDNNYEKVKASKPSTSTDGPVFLLGTHEIATDAEIREALPSQSAVHKLVTRYFNSYDPSILVLHHPTFNKMLQEHWQDPSKTSLLWLGLLYSILCLAMQSYHKIGDEPLEWKGATNELAAEYRLRTVQCLTNSDYTKSSEYTIETLMLYLMGEYNARWEAEVGIWVTIGMIVRLAMRMGYHRDPSKFPDVSPYQGEMRRRIWGFLRQMDTMFSFQLALPSMIRATDCDTQLPRNIHEDEFSPESKILPPSRPVTEPTPMSYMIHKAQIANELGAILEELNAVTGKGVCYDDILKRDNCLREIKMNIAPHLQLRPMEECTHDPATLLMQRFNLDILWQKTIVVLHRKYIARARQNPRYAHSRRACVEASLAILRHQSQLHRESLPGGRMRTMKWFISSLTKHDFLLAAMVVCLDLNYECITDALPPNEKPPGHNNLFWSEAQRADMLSSLETSQQIWMESSESSMEAYKAYQILKIILDKIKKPAAPKAEPALLAQPGQPISSNDVFNSFDQIDHEKLAPEHSAAMTLGMLSGGLSPNSQAMFGLAPSPGRYIDSSMNDVSGMGGGSGLTPYAMDGMQNPFSNLGGGNSPFSMFGNGMTTGVGMAGLDGAGGLDWDAWDSYIQNTTATNLNLPNTNTNQNQALDPGLNQFSFYPSTIDQAGNLNSPSEGTGTDGQSRRHDSGAGSSSQGVSPNSGTGGNGQGGGGGGQGQGGGLGGFGGSSVFMGAGTPGR